MTAMPQAPGWYPDPSGVPGRRFFNGTDWTVHRQNHPQVVSVTDTELVESVEPQRSTKSPILGGLLQLFFGMWGVGRFYIGSKHMGAVQLGLWLSPLLLYVVVGFALTVISTSALMVGLFIWVPLSIWVFIDALVIMTGNAKDSKGRPVK